MTSYQEWWPWLREFDPGEGLEVGAAWSCLVAPPLPYVVRFRVVVTDVAAGTSVSTRIEGDIKGSAALTLHPDGSGGTTARLRSSLLPTNPALRAFGMVARPLVGWGHDWVLDQGRRQFISAFDAEGPA